MLTDTSMIPLNRTEFAAALKKGQGRAFQHIAQYGIGDYEDLLLDACLHSKNYDNQVDPPRAPWLFSMIRDTPNYGRFRDAIFYDVDTSESWDLIQECHFLYEMILNGDQEAKRKLKEIVFTDAIQGSDLEYILVDFYIEFLTPEEFLDLVRIYGNRLIQDPEDEVPDSLIPDVKEREFSELLQQFGEEDIPIYRYRQYLAEVEKRNNERESIDSDTRMKNRHERIRETYTLDQILDDARNARGDFPGRYLTFGRHATREELEAIYHALLLETDPHEQLRLLWVFRRAPLPVLNDLLFEWVNGSDERIRDTVIYSLSAVSDDRVRQLALKLISNRELVRLNPGVISLFHHNYEKQDAGLITTALQSLEAEDEAIHSLGYDLRELVEIQPDPNLSDALRWVYESTPCMHCRQNALIELKKFNRIDARIAQEIHFDADHDIREFAKQLAAQQCALGK